jgi:hypothetical protein
MMIRRIAIPASVFALLAALPATGSAATIGQILDTPTNYDGHHVDVKGTVRDLQRKVSHHGNPYFTYSLCSAQCVPVIAFGDPAMSNGQTITVHGTYQSVKHVGDEYTFRNGIVTDGGDDSEIPCS